MGIIVKKFGGTSVANAERLKKVAEIIIKSYNEGNGVVAIVSAQGDTTDDLIEKAKEVNENPSKREMDVLLSTGEQMSMALLAMTIEKMGYPVISLSGWQVGINTDRKHGSARIHNIRNERLMHELDRKNIVIVAGFQGINRYDDITTLGRGGSDTSAVAIAASIGADLCQIYTDVNGVYSSDPRIVPDAVKLDDISYDEMLELASLGANVLHNRSVEMAKKYNVNLEVLSSFNDVPGTKVKEVDLVEKMLVRGVTRDNDCARVSIVGIQDLPGKAFRIFSLLSKENIGVDLILQSVGRDNTQDIAFTVTRGDLPRALEIIKNNEALIGASEISYNDKVSKVSIVGAGMVNNAGVATSMFEALFGADINILNISTSEIKISVLVDEEYAEKAVRAIHSKFDFK